MVELFLALQETSLSILHGLCVVVHGLIISLAPEMNVPDVVMDYSDLLGAFIKQSRVELQTKS